MRPFNYKNEYQKLLTPEIVGYLTQIHEQKGQQNLFIEAHKDVLSELLEVAKIQSTEASNRIEGIFTTDERLKKIVMDKTTPKNRGEREIAGYRDVLNTIHESYDYIPIRPGMIQQLHRDLYKFSNKAIGGSFKNSDNVIAEKFADGSESVRFEPVSAWETPAAMDSLCNAFDEALKDAEMDPLILIPMFILDFLCIHPFNDGNGRMSRLLTLLLLYRAGYVDHPVDPGRALCDPLYGWAELPLYTWFFRDRHTACDHFPEHRGQTESEAHRRLSAGPDPGLARTGKAFDQRQLSAAELDHGDRFRTADR